MKCTFETHDRDEARDLMRATELRGQVQDFDNWLRSKVKHGETADWPDAEEVLEFFRNNVEVW